MTTQVAPQKRGRRDRRRAVPGVPELPANVVLLHQRIMPRHTALLARWLEAGRRMGLCEASAFQGERAGVPSGPRQDYVLIWVRENIDPAYMIVPQGVQWEVVDTVRQQPLARLPSFAAALDFIRPALPIEVAA